MNYLFYLFRSSIEEMHFVKKNLKTSIFKVNIEEAVENVCNLLTDNNFLQKE
jgi:hypothetical protein